MVRNYTKKYRQAVTIIGGADGPTSTFIAGGPGRRSLKRKIHDCIHNYRKKRAERKITAGTHSLEEVAEYAEKRYGAAEADINGRRYVMQRNVMKENLILQHKPELLGDLKDISCPDGFDEESLRQYFERLQSRSEAAAQIPDSEIPMDFHIYEIVNGDNYFEIQIDYIWDIFSISYCGNKEVMKQNREIARDLYLYYGVSEADIREKTQRYEMLLENLII